MAARFNKPSASPFFYGRITREEAEYFLRERGSEEGLFLLRESISPLGNYAISICHNNKYVTQFLLRLRTVTSSFK